MSRLDALLNKEKQQLSSFSSEERDYPAKHLKHPKLSLSEKEPEFMIRILPPTSDEAPIASNVREMWINAVNSNGKDVAARIALSGQTDPTHQLEQQVNTWINTNSIPNKFGSKPQKRFYLNTVVLHKDAEGNFQHQVDASGNLVVRMLDCTQTLYEGILEYLGDENFDPAGSGDFRIISETNAYPIRIYRKGVKMDTTYHAMAYQKDLGKLTKNWREMAEDLEYQATPTEYEEVGYAVAVANGQEAEYQANQNSNSGGGESNPGVPLNQFSNQNKEVEVSADDLPSGMNTPPSQPTGMNTPPSQPQGQPADAQSAIDNDLGDLDEFMNDIMG